jgi:hypothetical protein
MYCIIDFRRDSVIILDEKNSCYAGLYESGIYEGLNINIKKLCDDYKSTIDYYNPVQHILPNQYSETVNINSIGFRGNEIQEDVGQYRIFFLGGSTAFGLYSTSDQTTIPGFLEEKFENMNVEIINAGINGANSFDETYTIKQKIFDLSPNLFIIYDGWNDLSNTIRVEYKEKTIQDEINLIFLHIKKYYKTIEFSEFLDRVITKQIYGDKGKPEESFSKNNIPKKITLWQDRWSEICEISNERGIKTVILIQPLLGTGNKELHVWEKFMTEKYAHQSIISSYDQFRSASLELDKHCSLIVDLSNVFDDRNELIFYDLGHMIDHGNEIIAEKIYEEISPIVLENISG